MGCWRRWGVLYGYSWEKGVDVTPAINVHSFSDTNSIHDFTLFLIKDPVDWDSLSCITSSTKWKEPVPERRGWKTAVFFNQYLYLMSEWTQPLEYYVFICHLQHVLSVWLSSDRITTIYRVAHEKLARHLLEQRGRGLGLCTGNETNANAKYLLVREGAENDLLLCQCTFVHAAVYCHTRDASQRCQFSEFSESTCDFYLWGYLKGKVYANNPKTLEDLKENIRTEIRRIDTAKLHRVCDNMLQLAQKCIDV